MEQEKIKELIKKDKEISLFISRINPELKSEFKSLARAEFCDDFGQTLFWIYSQCMEYQSMKALFFDKLQNMEDKIDKMNNSLDTKQEQRIEPRKTLGRRENEKEVKI